MIERLIEAGAKGAIAGLVGVIVYGAYYLIRKLFEKKIKK